MIHIKDFAKKLFAEVLPLEVRPFSKEVLDQALASYQDKCELGISSAEARDMVLEDQLEVVGKHARPLDIRPKR